MGNDDDVFGQNRYCMRFIPVDETSYANMEDIETMSERVFKPYFHAEDQKPTTVRSCLMAIRFGRAYFFFHTTEIQVALKEQDPNTFFFSLIHIHNSSRSFPRSDTTTRSSATHS